MATSSQIFVIYMADDGMDQSQKIMGVFMKEAFANTAKSCKWRSSTNKRGHFQMDVKIGDTSHEIDLFCMNGSETSLLGQDFQADDGTHRSLKMENIKGLIVVGKYEDPKDKKFKDLRDVLKAKVDMYKKEKGLGPKDFDFVVGVQNEIEAFDHSKLEKKLKDDKISDCKKAFFTTKTADTLTELVKHL